MNYYLKSMVAVSLAILLVFLIKQVRSVGVVPARFEGTFDMYQNFTVSFYIYDEEGGYFYLVPDENITRIIVPDCNYWCPNKTYYVEPNTYLTNGTRVTILMNSNVTNITGKVAVYPVTNESGTVSIIGGVAVSLDLEFVRSAVTTTTTTTSSTSSTSTTTTTTTQPKSSSSHSSHSGSGSGWIVHSTTTTTTTTTTIPYIITVGVSPAKVRIYDLNPQTTVTFKLWNDKGNVDANITIMPDENCSELIANELPKWVIVPKGTDMFNNPVTLNVTFKKPTSSFECGISFFGKPLGYKEQGGMIRIRRGVKARIFAEPVTQKLNQTTTTTLQSPQKEFSISPIIPIAFFGIGVAIFLFWFFRNFEIVV